MFFNEQRNKTSGPAKLVVYEQLCVCKSFVRRVTMFLCRITLQSRGTDENNAGCLHRRESCKSL